MKTGFSAAALAALLAWTPPVAASGPALQRPLPVPECFELDARRHGLGVPLLRAVAEQESGLDPRAQNRNRDGSSDTGLMQINSRWLPTLARHGIRAEDLWDPCTNVLIGAWILGRNFHAMGRTTRALGAYNAAHPERRERYARQVLARVRVLPLPASPVAPERRLPESK